MFVQLGKRSPAPARPVSFRRPLSRAAAADDLRTAQAWGATVGLTVPDSDG